jgi:hypothetical protein
MTITILDQGYRIGYTDQVSKDEKKTTNEKPVTLAPLNLKEALEGLLKVKPKPKQKKPRKTQTKKSSD